MNAPLHAEDTAEVFVPSPELSRRMLLGSGAGLVLALSLPGTASAADEPKYGADSQPGGARDDPRLFVQLAPDGGITIICHRAEMGQGIRSSMAMIILDEMGADWNRLSIRQAEGDEARYGNQNTDGSRSIRHWLVPLRRCGAAMRMMLLQAASTRLGVPVGELDARDHKIVHARSGRSLPFGDLAGDAAKLAVPPRDIVQLKDASALTMVGKDRVFAHDGQAMTTGTATYGIDATMPGMLFAAVARPPVMGSKAASFDAAAARAVAGVVDVIELPAPAGPPLFQPLGGIAVIAKNSWAAMKGRDALKIDWAASPHDSYDSRAYRDLSLANARKPGQPVRSEGDVDAALAKAKKRVVAEYYLPHIAHATMEPPAAVVRCDGESCEALACVQDPSGTRDTLAAMLKLDKARVVVRQTFLGGGFGRKSKPDFVVEAAMLSRAMKGTPIKIVWSREDDVRHDYYHTVAVQRLEAAMDGDLPSAWLHRVVSPSIISIFADGIDREQALETGLGLLSMPFAIPNVRIETGEALAHTRIGWFRSVANIPHAFAIQCFAAELAEAARQDPKDYLLRLLGPDRKIDPRSIKDANYGEDPALYPIDTGRLRRVVEVAAKGVGWNEKRPKGWGYGIACHRSFVSYTACAFAVSVTDGQLTIHKADIAIDCGAQVNPDRIRAQMEGSVMMGLSLALSGEISFAKGAVQQGSFDDYPVLRIDAAPRKLDVHLVGGGLDTPPSGVGEPGVPPVAPALCNAIHAATGRRIRVLPIGDQLTGKVQTL
ncbi:MAG: molybdopterin cofactor-binding domain-containing protein [Alphaproteobacteria bacterium]